MTGNRELALLIDGTRLSPNGSQTARIRETVERGIDWGELMRVALPHGVLPLLSRNLEIYAATAAPQDTLVQLQRFSRRVAERNRQQSLALAELVSALSQDGFRVLPFKGPTFALTFYGDMNLRESHDLDLWIDPAQFGDAMEWFLAAGYSPIHHVQGVPQELTSRRKKFEEFWSPDRDVVVEIKAHIELTEASAFDPPFEEVWDRRGQAMIHAIEIGMIPVEDLLPALAVHGSKHFWRRLNWIVDIAALISARPGPDWEVLLSRATAWKCRQRLLTAVGLAEHFYGTNAPEILRSGVQSSAVRSTVAHVSAALFREKMHSFAGLGSDFLYCLRSCDSIGERLRYLGSSRHLLNRILSADEKRMMLPMSDRVRRIYDAFAAMRNRCRDSRP